jgi:hypothetical protein
LNFFHANLYDCGTKEVDAKSVCKSIPYFQGDEYTIMGRYPNTRHLNAASKVSAGWIPASRVLNVTAEGNYTIYPTEKASTGPQALVINKPDTSSKYYLDYRQSYGFDAGLPLGITGGVSIIDGQQGITYRYDANPGDKTKTCLGFPEGTYCVNDFTNSAMSDGKPFYDWINGLTITQISHNSSSATVNVKFSSPACVKARPWIHVNTLSSGGAAGIALAYNIYLRNEDTPGCAPAIYKMSAILPSGWTASFDKNEVTLNPRASINFNVDVTPPLNTPIGKYQFTVTATDKSNPAYASSWTADFNVTSGSAPDTTVPTASITAPTNNSTVSGTTNITASATDNVGVTKVEFYIDGTLKTTDTSTPYSYSWDTTVVANGSHVIYAKAYDAANNAGTSSTVSVNVSNTTSTAVSAAITTPAADSIVSGIVPIRVTTANKSLSNDYIILYIDGRYVASAVPRFSTLSYNWNTAGYANGAHTITVNIGSSSSIVATASINVTVNNALAGQMSLDEIALAVQNLRASMADIVRQIQY